MNHKLLSAKFPTKERCEVACDVIDNDQLKPFFVNEEWCIENSDSICNGIVITRHEEKIRVSSHTQITVEIL